MKKFFIFLLLTMLGFALFCPPTLAAGKKEDSSIGRQIGAGARQAADEAKSAAIETREAAVELSRKIARGAKESYQKVKKAAQEFAQDVRSGFQKGTKAE